MIREILYKKFWQELKKHNHFLITTHINPDGDGLSSVLIFASILKSLKKKYYIVMEDVFPDKYKFLLLRYAKYLIPEYIHVPASMDLRTLLPSQFHPEGIIIIDTAGINRLGNFVNVIPEFKLKTILNIDHHKGKRKFPGTVDLVDDKASSTSEIIYDLLKINHYVINKDIAELLYMALISDTKNFTQSNTTEKSHAMAAELIKMGIQAEKINYYFQEIPATTLKVFAHVIARLNIELDGRLVWSYVTKDELQQCIDRNVDGLIEMLRTVEGTAMAVLFKEIEENKTKVCLRGKRGLNVFQIAKAFKGGGHLQASGFILNKKMNDAIKIVLNKVKTYLI